MLYMAVYTAADENRATGDDERHAAFHQVLSNAGTKGLIMRGVYADGPANTMYFLFEAESVDRLDEVFKPMLGFGRLESVPVIDRLAL